MSKEESSRLLLETSNRSIENEKEQKAFDEILKELDNFPLAIELVGGFLTEHPSIAFQDYLGFFEDMLLEKINEEFPLVSFTKHEQSIIRTLKINEKLLKEKPYLEDILDILAWSGSSPMGYSLLQTLTAIANTAVLTIALSDLSNLRLVKEEKDTKRYTIHRLLATVRRHENPLEERTNWHRKVVKNLEDWFRKQVEEGKTLACAEPELEHLEIWQKNTLKYIPSEAVWLTLLKALPLIERGNYKEARKYIEEAEELYKAENLTDKLLLANILKKLSVMDYFLGNYEKSRSYIEKALDFYDKNLISEKSLLASLTNGLGVDYAHSGDYEKALKLFQQALEIQRELFGEKHPDIARSLNNLGAVYRSLNDYKKALDFKKQALDMRRELFGEKHPDIAISLFNLGYMYGSLDNHEKALDYYQQTLDMRRELFGEKHPDIAISLNNLGVAYENLGDHEKALELFQQALEMQRELFDEINLEMIRTSRNLVMALSKAGKMKDAEKLADEFLSYDLPNVYDKRFFEGYSKKRKNRW